LHYFTDLTRDQAIAGDTMINGWAAEAFNQAPDSANEIHGDKIAKQFGFTGGLVPGVTISAYLIQPAIEAWGLDWLTRGFAHVRVGSPLYDEEQFNVQITKQSDSDYKAELLRPDGTLSANAEVSLPEVAATAPTRRGDPTAEEGYVGAAASFERWAELKEVGCKAIRYHWGEKHRMQTYLRDASLMSDLLRQNNGDYANMGYLLGISNWILSGNAHMNPWIHLETSSQNYQPVPAGTSIIAEMSVEDFYERKGHEFVDANIALFDEKDDSCLSTISIRAIYKLRGM
jgi:hypothetical protein